MTIRTATTWRERLTSPLNWHAAGFIVLLVVVIVLGVRLGLDWAATNGRSSDALSQKQVELRAREIQTAPLRGLDKRVEESRTQIKAFYEKRIPADYSSISTHIGELEVKSGVRLSRVQYTQGPPGGDLTEISLDCGISGAYPDIMRFVNGLERDQNFFVIRAMQLAGQQGGQVNLRIRVSTWLRAADAAASGLPPTPTPGDEAPSTTPTAGSTGGGKEGE
jgi:Tfp pilus assembly protein PilO